MCTSLQKVKSLCEKAWGKCTSSGGFGKDLGIVLGVWIIFTVLSKS